MFVDAEGIIDSQTEHLMAYAPSTFQCVYCPPPDSRHLKLDRVSVENFFDDDHVTLVGHGSGVVREENIDSLLDDYRDELPKEKYEKIKQEEIELCRTEFGFLTKEMIQSASEQLQNLVLDGWDILFIRTDNYQDLSLIGLNKDKKRDEISKYFKKFEKESRESDIYVMDVNYIQEDKIDGIYNQIVERVEEEQILRKEESNAGEVSGNVTLGRLLSYIGIDIGVEAGVEEEQVTSKEILYELTDIQKCTLIYKTLAKSNQLSNLNDDIAMGLEPSDYVRFEATIWCQRPEEIEEDREDTGERGWPFPKSSIEFSGRIEDYHIRFKAFGRYFRYSPNVASWFLGGQEFPTQGFASVLNFDSEDEEIILSPIALWGDSPGPWHEAER